MDPDDEITTVIKKPDPDEEITQEIPVETLDEMARMWRQGIIGPDRPTRPMRPIKKPEETP